MARKTTTNPRRTPTGDRASEQRLTDRQRRRAKLNRDRREQRHGRR